jgi:SPW repeat-containing protein
MESENRGIIQSLGGINIILGIWLIVTPYVFGYTSSAAKWNQTIFGVVVLILAALRLGAMRQQWISFLNGLAAIWLVIAPFILSYNRSVAYWNEVIVGVIVGVLAFWNSGVSLTATHTRHHGTA